MKRINTPYGPKSPELLTRAMDALESPLYRAAPAMLKALKTPPIPPSDLDTQDGMIAYIKDVFQWLDGPCADAIAQANGGGA